MFDLEFPDQSTTTTEWPFAHYHKNLKDTAQVELGRQLLYEAKAGSKEEIKELVAAGAPFTADWVGTSPLHMTAHYGHVDVTELLLRAGISHDSRNKVDRTPLHTACQNGHYDIVKLLLAFGADYNAKDMLRMTPLHWAAYSGVKDIVRTLLDHGAVNCVSKFGKTPSDVAEDRGFYDVVKLIEEIKALPSEERNYRINKTRTESAVMGKKLRHADEGFFDKPNGDILRMVQKRKKIRLVVTNPSTNRMQILENLPVNKNSLLLSNGFNAEKTLQLLKDHGITMEEPDNGTVVSSVVENGHSVKLTEAGELALNSSKPKTPPLNKPTTIHIPKVDEKKTFQLPNGKKIIQIKADELINMTKEKKVIIKQTRTLPNARYFEGKIYTDKENDELLERMNTRLLETVQEVDKLKSTLIKKEEEVENLKKNIELIIKQVSDKK